MMVLSCSGLVISCGGVCGGAGAVLGAGGATVVLPFIGRSAEPDVPDSVPAPPPGLMGPETLLKGAWSGWGLGPSGSGADCCCACWSCCAGAQGLRLKPRSAATAIHAKPGFMEISSFLKPRNRMRAKTTVIAKFYGHRIAKSNRQSIRRARAVQVAPRARLGGCLGARL